MNRRKLFTAKVKAAVAAAAAGAGLPPVEARRRSIQ